MKIEFFGMSDLAQVANTIVANIALLYPAAQVAKTSPTNLWKSYRTCITAISLFFLVQFFKQYLCTNRKKCWK